VHHTSSAAPAHKVSLVELCNIIASTWYHDTIVSIDDQNLGIVGINYHWFLQYNQLVDDLLVDDLLVVFHEILSSM